MLNLLFEKLSKHNLTITESDAKSLVGEKLLRTLKNKNILSHNQNLQEILCGCGEFHPIFVENGKSRYGCSSEEGGIEEISLDELILLELQPEVLLKELFPKATPTNADGIFQTGTHFFKDFAADIFLIKGLDDKYTGVVKEKYRNANKIIFTISSAGSMVKDIDSGILVISICEVVKNGAHGFVLDDKKLSEAAYSVFWGTAFRSNGDLIVNGVRLLSVSPNTLDYFFLQKIWKHFNQPVSHEDLQSFCLSISMPEGIKPAISLKGPAEFCYEIRKSLKRRVNNKKIFDLVVVSTKTIAGSSAYKLTSI